MTVTPFTSITKIQTIVHDQGIQNPTNLNKLSVTIVDTPNPVSPPVSSNPQVARWEKDHEGSNDAAGKFSVEGGFAGGTSGIYQKAKRSVDELSFAVMPTGTQE